MVNGFTNHTNKKNKKNNKKNKKNKKYKKNITINIKNKNNNKNNKSLDNDIVSFNIENFKLPIKLTTNIVHKLLNQKSNDQTSKLMMYI